MPETPPLPPQRPRPMVNEPPWGLEVPLSGDDWDTDWGSTTPWPSTPMHQLPVATSEPVRTHTPRHVLVLLDLNEDLGRSMVEHLIQALSALGRMTPAEELRAHLEAALDAEAEPEGADDGH